MKILMVVTSHDQLGDTGHKTGIWLEEFAAPYYVFREAGAEVVIVSPKGGQPPLDPKSDAPDAQSEATRRFKSDADALHQFAHTGCLADVDVDAFDAVFYPGGHGPLWDLSKDPDSIALIEKTYAAGKPVAAVCHGPAVLLGAQRQGQPLVKGKHVTSFSNSEEEAVQLTKVVPFLLEDEFKRLGGLYERGADWGSFIQVDGNLITGQNPASSEAAAKALLQQLS